MYEEDSMARMLFHTLVGFVIIGGFIMIARCLLDDPNLSIDISWAKVFTYTYKALTIIAAIPLSVLAFRSTYLWYMNMLDVMDYELCAEDDVESSAIVQISATDARVHSKYAKIFTGVTFVLIAVFFI